MVAPLGVSDLSLGNIGAGLFFLACTGIARIGAATRGGQLSESVDYLDTDEYERARTLLRWVSPVLFVGCVVAAWVLLIVLRWATALHLHWGADVYLSSRFAWFMPALVLASPLSVTAEVYALRWMGIIPDRYYKSHARVARADLWHETWFDGFALGLGFVLVAMGLNYAAVFREGSIVLRPTFEKADKRYAYPDVAAIYRVKRFRAPSGRIVTRTRFVVEFADGYRWTTEDGMHGADPAADAVVMAKVAKRSGREIREVDLLPPEPTSSPAPVPESPPPPVSPS